MLSKVSRVWYVLLLLYYTCIQKLKYLSGHKMIADKIQSDAFLCCQADNPLFLDATTTVTNPTFTGEWAALPLISWNLSYISQHVSVMQDHLINWKAFKIDHKSWVLFMIIIIIFFFCVMLQTIHLSLKLNLTTILIIFKHYFSQSFVKRISTGLTGNSYSPHTLKFGFGNSYFSSIRIQYSSLLVPLSGQMIEVQGRGRHLTKSPPNQTHSGEPWTHPSFLAGLKDANRGRWDPTASNSDNLHEFIWWQQ